MCRLKTSISPPKIPGVNGLVSYDIYRVNIKDTILKFIMFIGEEHGLQSHCTENYVDMYESLIKKAFEKNIELDIFIEKTSNQIENGYDIVKNNIWLNSLRKKFETHIYNHNKVVSLLRVHWIDPIYEYKYNSKYSETEIFKEKSNQVQFIEQLIKLKHLFIRTKISEKIYFIIESKLKTDYSLFFSIIHSEATLVNIILLNKALIKQAKKSVLSENYISFIKVFFNLFLENIKKDKQDYTWFIDGVFFTQRVSIDFYVFFRMIRKDKPFIKNVIYHVGNNHILWISEMFYLLSIYKTTDYTIESIIKDDSKKSIKNANRQCLDFTFDIFITASEPPPPYNEEL